MNFIEPILRYCKSEYSVEVIDKAAWCLANLVSGPDEYSYTLFNLGGAKTLMALLFPPYKAAWESLIWALANSISDSDINRESLLKSGLVPLLKHVYSQTEESDVRIQRALVWAVACLGKSPMDLQPAQANKLIEIAAEAIKLTDETVKTQACWALSHLAVREEYAELIVATNLIGELKKAALEGSLPLQVASLNAMGSLCASNDNHTGYALHNGVLEFLPDFIQESSPKIRKAICWIVSNVAGSSYSHAYLLSTLPIFTLSIQLLFDVERIVRNEASYVLSNFAIAQMRYSNLVADLEKFFPEIAQSLNISQDSCYLIRMLDACRRVILAGYDAYSDNSKMIKQFEAAGCFESLQKLERHLEPTVVEKVFEIQEEIYHMQNEADEFSN